MVQVVEGYELVGKEEAGRPSIVMAVEGRDKKGKTYFGLTAPGPIALINLDAGTKRVVDNFLGKKKIFAADMSMELNKREPDYAAVWKRIEKIYYAALESKIIRTVVIDSWTECWTVYRMAHWGRIALPPEASYKYGPANADMARILRNAVSSNKNVVLTVRLKAEYVKDEYTGEWVPDGWSKTRYEVQDTIKVDRNEDDDFMAAIVESRNNGEARGDEFVGPLCSFPFVAQTLIPESEEKDWT